MTTTSRKPADNRADNPASDLATSKDGIVSAIETAQAALKGLADAIDEHNTLARRHAMTASVVDGAEVLRITHQRVHVALYEPQRYHLVHSTGRRHQAGQVAANLVARVAPPALIRPTNTSSTEETNS